MIYLCSSSKYSDDKAGAILSKRIPRPNEDIEIIGDIDGDVMINLSILETSCRLGYINSLTISFKPDNPLPFVSGDTEVRYRKHSLIIKGDGKILDTGNPRKPSGLDLLRIETINPYRAQHGWYTMSKFPYYGIGSLITNSNFSLEKISFNNSSITADGLRLNGSAYAHGIINVNNLSITGTSYVYETSFQTENIIINSDSKCDTLDISSESFILKDSSIADSSITSHNITISDSHVVDCSINGGSIYGKNSLFENNNINYDPDLGKIKITGKIKSDDYFTVTVVSTDKIKKNMNVLGFGIQHETKVSAITSSKSFTLTKSARDFKNESISLTLYPDYNDIYRFDPPPATTVFFTKCEVNASLNVSLLAAYESKIGGNILADTIILKKSATFFGNVKAEVLRYDSPSNEMFPITNNGNLSFQSGYGATPSFSNYERGIITIGKNDIDYNYVMNINIATNEGIISILKQPVSINGGNNYNKIIGEPIQAFNFNNEGTIRSDSCAFYGNSTNDIKGQVIGGSSFSENCINRGSVSSGTFIGENVRNFGFVDNGLFLFSSNDGFVNNLKMYSGINNNSAFSALFPVASMFFDSSINNVGLFATLWFFDKESINYGDISGSEIKFNSSSNRGNVSGENIIISGSDINGSIIGKKNIDIYNSINHNSISGSGMKFNFSTNSGSIHAFNFENKNSYNYSDITIISPTQLVNFTNRGILYGNYNFTEASINEGTIYGTAIFDATSVDYGIVIEV